MELIDVRPGVRRGQPCFVGTRITVRDVVEYLAAGMTPADVQDDFPELTEEQINAAIALSPESVDSADDPGTVL